MCKKIGFLYLIMLLPFSVAFAADFGVVFGGTPGYDSTTDPGFVLTGNVHPWVSAILSPTVNLYVSAALSLSYEHEDPQPFLPELDRTELVWQPAPAALVQFGRQRFWDSAGLIATGLFDGARVSRGYEKARFSLGAFYTGLLYKETVEILMTGPDRSDYTEKFSYDDPANYFASRRVVVPLSVEFPDLTLRSSLNLNVIGQFDVNTRDGEGNTLHSQYLEIHYLAEPWEPLHISIAAATGLAEDPDLRLGLAASAGADWELPTAVPDSLSLQFRWSSGRVNDTMGAFSPINSISPGEIFTPRFSALMYGKTAYTVRPHKTLSATAGAGYFIRTDTETLGDPEFDPNTGADSRRLLGGEMYGFLVWAPDAVIRITALAGAFFPGWGDVFVSGAAIRWKTSLGLMVSF
ncbi:hypothetical protein [Treponema primitia]|uniref:hypothetical protein n=1 Tax=Treponema primitia TaxID=88058 RepID=UPI00025557A9|nr:hypothetical protein [Treponema primitia]